MLDIKGVGMKSIKLELGILNLNNLNMTFVQNDKKVTQWHVYAFKQLPKSNSKYKE